MDCLFCKIVRKEMGALIYEDEQVIAFDDIAPQAPHHILIVPKRHISTINDMVPTDEPLLGHLIQVAKTMAKKRSIDEKGYRLVFNCNPDGGQAVYHIHLHLLGGRQMQWPAG